MVAELARNWWLLAIRGGLGILFGIGAFIWPEITLAVLILMFGAYVLVDGIFVLLAGIAMRRHSYWWVMALQGVASIVVGALTFAWPGVTTLVLLYFISSWSIVTGAFEIAMAIQLRKTIENEWVRGFSGALSILFGLLLVALPGTGILSVVWVVGLYAFSFGIFTLMVAFRLRGVRNTANTQATGMA